LPRESLVETSLFLSPKGFLVETSLFLLSEILLLSYPESPYSPLLAAAVAVQYE
jgi:hypothetical protein